MIRVDADCKNACKLDAQNYDPRLKDVVVAFQVFGVDDGMEVSAQNSSCEG